MANMSYCRFENTYKDLRDCYEALLEEEELSETEENYKNKLVALCGQIYADFESEDED